MNVRTTEAPHISERRGAPPSNRPITSRMRKAPTDVTPRSVSKNHRLAIPLYQSMAASSLASNAVEIESISEAILSAAQFGVTYDKIADALENEIGNLVEFAVNGNPFSMPPEKLEMATRQLSGAVHALTIVRVTWAAMAEQYGPEMGPAVEVVG